MKLPLIISVAHAGLEIPPEVQDYCILSSDQILQDGDEGAGKIYDLRGEVTHFVTTSIARAIVDMNRAPDDRREDGVVKTHTCWNIPVYRAPLTEGMVQTLLANYYQPYHNRLSKLSQEVLFGIDCHTMAGVGPPLGPDEGQERPHICLSNAEGSCSQVQLERLAGCLEEQFGFAPAFNKPFRGGYIIRAHAAELPWVQLELSRSPFCSLEQKHLGVRAALKKFCRTL